MPQQSGQQCWVVWRAIMARYLPGVSRPVNHAIGWLTAVGRGVNYRPCSVPVCTTGITTITLSIGGSRRRTQGNG
jgi:hypothetical protein